MNFLSVCVPYCLSLNFVSSALLQEVLLVAKQKGDDET